MAANGNVIAPPHLVYLFSSNTSPLYVQDILNVLAAPPGTHYRFRYEESIAAQGVSSAGLAGQSALVVFSLHQVAHYHEPAFIPIRCVRIITADIEAGMWVITFEILDYVALKRHGNDAASAVVSFTKALADANIPRPYGTYLGVGQDISTDVSLFERSDSQLAAFRSTVELLQQAEPFRCARFIRFHLLREKSTVIPCIDGSFKVKAGRSHELMLSHFEPGVVTDRCSFEIDTDGDIVKVVGRPGFDVASSYDVPILAVYTSPMSRPGVRSTQLTIRPAEGVQGATIVLHITIVEPWKRELGKLALTSLALFLVGVPAIASHLSSPLKVMLVICGAVIASALQSFGRSVSIPGGFGFASANHPPQDSNSRAGRMLL